jgi:hypothetical protein
MEKKILGIFTTDKLHLLHYVFLTIALFIGFYLGESYLNLSELNIIGMFAFWLFVLYVADQIIHKLMGI